MLLVKKESVAKMQRRHQGTLLGVKDADMTEADRKHRAGLERRSIEIDREIMDLDLRAAQHQQHVLGHGLADHAEEAARQIG